MDWLSVLTILGLLVAGFAGGAFVAWVLFF